MACMQLLLLEAEVLQQQLPGLNQGVTVTSCCPAAVRGARTFQLVSQGRTITLVELLQRSQALVSKKQGVRDRSGRMALAAQRRVSFLGAPAASRVAVRPALSRQQVKAQAFFGFGGSKPSADTAAPQYYICIDCGYIYPDGEFKKAPGSYRCPVCNSPKSRFKVYKGAVKGKPNNSGAAMKQRFSARQW